MAKGNFIDATSIVESLNKVFQQQEQIVKEVSVAVSGLASNYGKLPSNLNASVKTYNDLLKQQENNVKALEKAQQAKAIAIEKAKERERLAEIKLQQAREKSVDQFNKQLAKEEAVLQKQETAYNRIQGSVNKLKQTYQDLAIRKQLGNTLSVKEEAQLVSITNRLNMYQTALKKVDADIQNHQRNVGNYAGSFNGLSNSINQITRELPAFTFSAQTGFLALSNNIPILVDEIGRLKDANRELVAQGKPVKSVFSQIVGSLFSMQTAMGIGILLFTLYGKEIGKFITGLFNAGRSIQTVSDQMKQLSETRVKASELASKEISELDRLYKNSQNVTLSINERKSAVDKLQDLYPNYLANINDENILNGKAETQYYKLRDAILAKYQAEAIGEKLAENTRGRLEDYLELQKDIKETEDEINRLRKSGNSLVIEGSRQDKTQKQTISNNDLILAQERLLTIQKSKLNQFKKDARKEDSVLLDLQAELLRQSEGLNKKEKETTNETSKSTTAKKEKNKETAKEIDLLKGTESWYEKQISKLKELRATTADNTEEYKSYNAQLFILEQGLKALRGELSEIDGEGLKLDLYGEDPAKAFEDWKLGQKSKDVKEVDDALKQLFQTISNDTLSNLGFSSLIPIFDNTFSEMWDKAETFTEKFAVGMKYIGDVAVQAFAMISQAEQANYEQSFRNLELQKENALMFAGESATAREEIERQYDEKRRVIQRRQAEAQKKQAIFGILINTAQAVVSALASTPPNVPLSIAVGAIGAIQAGIVASQQIPQFAKGTENAPEGWAWTQEQGREIITDRHGKIKSTGTDSGAKLTYLNKGDKVLTNSITEQLNNQLISSGIAPIIINNENDIVGRKIDNLAKIIANKESVIIQDDANGRNYYQRKRGETVKIMNSRINIKGYDV